MNDFQRQVADTIQGLTNQTALNRKGQETILRALQERIQQAIDTDDALTQHAGRTGHRAGLVLVFDIIQTILDGRSDIRLGDLHLDGATHIFASKHGKLRVKLSKHDGTLAKGLRVVESAGEKNASWPWDEGVHIIVHESLLTEV